MSWSRVFSRETELLEAASLKCLIAIEPSSATYLCFAGSFAKVNGFASAVFWSDVRWDTQQKKPYTSVGQINVPLSSNALNLRTRCSPPLGTMIVLITSMPYHGC
jgi:hypothetical protein